MKDPKPKHYILAALIITTIAVLATLIITTIAAAILFAPYEQWVIRIIDPEFAAASTTALNRFVSFLIILLAAGWTALLGFAALGRVKSLASWLAD